MVRSYDPSRSDTSQIIIKKIKQTFQENFNRISDKVAKLAIQNFLDSHDYDNFFNKYTEKNLELPNINFFNECKKQHFFLKLYNEIDLTKFQSYYDLRKNEINICTQKIQSLLELKENLDRELQMAFEHKINLKDLTKNKDYACSAIISCKKQFSNYNNLDNNLQENLTRQCARYMVRQRGPNEEKQPYDIWIRQSNLLVEENLYCFNEK